MNIEPFIGIGVRSTDPVQKSDNIFMDSKKDDEEYYLWGHDAM
jgi:hypothetical protein